MGKSRKNSKEDLYLLDLLRQGKKHPDHYATEEELERDFSGNDKVPCRLCNTKWVMLGGHINKSHGITAQEYRELFNIPARFGLAGEEFKKVQGEVMTTNHELGKIPSDKKAPSKRRKETSTLKVGGEVSVGEKSNGTYFPKEFLAVRNFNGKVQYFTESDIVSVIQLSTSLIDLENICKDPLNPRFEDIRSLVERNKAIFTEWFKTDTIYKLQQFVNKKTGRLPFAHKEDITQEALTEISIIEKVNSLNKRFGKVTQDVAQHVFKNVYRTYIDMCASRKFDQKPVKTEVTEMVKAEVKEDTRRVSSNLKYPPELQVHSYMDKKTVNKITNIRYYWKKAGSPANQFNLPILKKMAVELEKSKTGKPVKKISETVEGIEISLELAQEILDKDSTWNIRLVARLADLGKDAKLISKAIGIDLDKVNTIIKASQAFA